VTSSRDLFRMVKIYVAVHQTYISNSFPVILDNLSGFMFRPVFCRWQPATDYTKYIVSKLITLRMVRIHPL